MDFSSIMGGMGGGGGMSAGSGMGIAASMFGGIISGAQKKATAKQQQKEARNLQKQANELKADPIQQEFLQKQAADQMAALSGLPNYQNYASQIDQTLANQVRTIKESSPSGAATLAAVSGAYGGQRQAVNNLMMKDVDYRTAMGENVRNDLFVIGNEKNRLDNIKRDKQQRMLQQAAALLNAGTANEQAANDQIIGTVTSSISSAFGGGSGGAAVGQPLQQPAQAPAATPSYISGTGIGTASYAPQTNYYNPYMSIARSPYASSVNSNGFWQ